MKENYFDKALEYGTMRRALNRVCRDVRWKDSVVGYEIHGPQKIHELKREIKSGKRKISKYQEFTIYEPKKRAIKATRIDDRHFQMALCMA